MTGILPQIRALLIDLDGVVFRGESPLPGAQTAIPRLRAMGIAFAFVTNNATLTPSQVATKLRKMGVQADPADVVTSAEATAAYLRATGPPGATVSLIGEGGLLQAMTDAGFAIDPEDPTFVVVSLDRYVTYERIAHACLAIQRGARLIATNADPAIPVEGGLWPGAGAILAMLVTATGAQPTIIGKPEPTILQVALDRLGVAPEDAAMIGDQVRSDVRAGRAVGTATVLVKGDLAEPASDVEPDLTVASLDELLSILERSRFAARASGPRGGR